MNNEEIYTLLRIVAPSVGKNFQDAPPEGSIEFLMEPYGTWFLEGWNPYFNSGDALELAVLFNLKIEIDGTHFNRTTVSSKRYPAIIQSYYDSFKSPTEATRYAILKMSALIVEYENSV
jgi:hypothetical protein